MTYRGSRKPLKSNSVAASPGAKKTKISFARDLDYEGEETSVDSDEDDDENGDGGEGRETSRL